MITTVIPVYNTKISYLQECFKSVLEQTMKTPVVIIDDGGKEELGKYLQTICAKNSWTYFHQENSGLSGAMNAALSLVNTEWILKIDADDRALPELTKKLHDYAFIHSHVAAISCQLVGYEKNNFIFKSEHPEEITLEYAWKNEKEDYWLLNHTGVLLNRNILLNVGGYPCSREFFSEDYELWINLLLAGEEMRTIPDYLLRYRIVSDSLTMKNKNRKNEKFLEDNRKKLSWRLKKND